MSNATNQATAATDTATTTASTNSCTDSNNGSSTTGTKLLTITTVNTGEAEGNVRTNPFRAMSWYSPVLEPADRVLPDLELYIGGIEAREHDWLLVTKITHIVDASNITSISPSFRGVEPQSTKTFILSIYDAPTVRIDKHFGDTNKFIDEALEGGGRVLVHCMAGVSRSASLVIAFLIWRYNWTLRAALAAVTRARPIVSPNSGFRKQLAEYEKKVLELKGLNAPLPFSR